MSTIEIKGRATRREYSTTTDGEEPTVWIAGRTKSGRPKWGTNMPAMQAAKFFRYMQKRRKERDSATPEQRKQRMAAKWTARMKAMAERTPASSRDLSRERKARQRSYIEPIRVRQY